MANQTYKSNGSNVLNSDDDDERTRQARITFKLGNTGEHNERMPTRAIAKNQRHSWEVGRLARNIAGGKDFALPPDTGKRYRTVQRHGELADQPGSARGSRR